MNAGRNRQFGCHPPGVARKQNEAIRTAFDCGRVVESCLAGIHLLQQKTGDWAAAIQTLQTGFSGLERERSGLAP